MSDAQWTVLPPTQDDRVNLGMPEESEPTATSFEVVVDSGSSQE